MAKPIVTHLLYDSDKQYPYISLFEHGNFSSPLFLLNENEARTLMEDINHCLKRIEKDKN